MNMIDSYEVKGVADAKPKEPKPFNLESDKADFPQQMHELTCGLAAEMNVDLCDVDSDIEDPQENEGVIRMLRIIHDEAVRHGAECEGYEPAD